MATVNGIGSTSLGSGSSTTLDLTATVAASQTLLIAGVAQRSAAPAIVSVVWDPAGVGEALSLAILEDSGGSSNGTDRDAAFYYKFSPTAGASKVLQVTWGSATDRHGLVAAEVDGTTTVTAPTTASDFDTGTTTTPTRTITPGAANSIGFAFVSGGASQGPYTDASTPALNEIYDFDIAGTNAPDVWLAELNDLGAAASKTFAATCNNDEWAMVAVTFAPAAGVTTRRYSLPLTGVG